MCLIIVIMVSVEFLVTSLVVVLIPGTGVVYTVSTGLAQGRRASVFAALGCTAGIVPHLLATVLGLAAIMHTSALAFQALKYAGVAYLFYVAFSTWRDTSAFAVDSSCRGLLQRAWSRRRSFSTASTLSSPSSSSPFCPSSSTRRPASRCFS